MQQEVEMFVGVGVVVTGSHVDVDGVWQRRMEMTTTSITAAHFECLQRSHPLRHDGVLQAPEPDIARCRRPGEVDQGQVNALTVADDDSPRARRCRHWGRQTDIRWWSQWPVIGQKAAETVYCCRSFGRTTHFDHRRHYRITIRWYHVIGNMHS